MIMSRILGSDRPAFKRILAVKLADLGDLLTITPALQALHDAHPDAQIDLLTTPASARLLLDAPYIGDIIAFDKFPFDSLRSMLNPSGAFDTLRLLLRLRLSRYDAIAIFHHFTGRWGAVKFAVLALAGGARARAGWTMGVGGFSRSRCLTVVSASCTKRITGCT